MSKQVFRGIAILFVAAMLLTACAPAAAPTTAAPAAAATANWCSGVKIVFFPGGTPGGGFEQVVYNGAVQAAKDTGADVQYVWSDWDPAKMTTQFQQAAATKPDGIAVMGHPGDTAFDPLIDAAESQGIIVTSMNTQLPTAQAKVRRQWFWLRRRHSLPGRIRPGRGSR